MLQFPDRRRTFSSFMESTEDLHEQIRVANETIEQMEKDLEKATTFGKQLIEDKHELWEKMYEFEKQCQRELDFKDDEIAQLHNDLDALKEDQKSLRSRFTILQNDFDTKTVQVLELRHEKDDLQALVYKLQRDLSSHLTMVNESRETKQENLKLQRELHSSRELVAELQEQNSQFKQKVGRSEALERSLKDMDELAVEVFELRKQVDMFERQKMEDMETISHLRRFETDNEELKKSNEELKGKVTSSNEKYRQAMQLVAGMEDDLQYTRATLQRMKAAEQAGQAVRSKGVSLAEELGLGQKEVEEGEKKQEPDPPLPQKQPEPVVEEKVVVVEKLVEVEKLVPGPAPDPVIVYVPQEEDPAEAEQRRQKLLHEAKAGLRSALEADFRREIELLAVYKERFDRSSVRRMSVRFKQLNPVETLKMCIAELHKIQEDLDAKAMEDRVQADSDPILGRMNELFVEVMKELGNRKIAYLESNLEKVEETWLRQEEAMQQFRR